MFDVTTESTPAAHALRAKMRAFYDAITNYDAFAGTNDLPGYVPPSARRLDKSRLWASCALPFVRIEPERAQRGDALGA